MPAGWQPAEKRYHDLVHCKFSQQVREVAEEAIARARRGDGPTLIEAETYRYRGHSLADPDELRSKEEKAKYAVSNAATRLQHGFELILTA